MNRPTELRVRQHSCRLIGVSEKKNDLQNVSIAGMLISA